MLLSLDLGTSKLCAVALALDTLEPIAIRSTPNDADVPGLPAEYHEQNPTRVFERVLALVRDLLADEKVHANKVRGIAISGQMHGVLLADRDLRPLTHCIIWRDQRTAEPETSPGGIAEARQAVGPDAAARAGCDLHPGYGGATLHWLARNGGLPDGAVALSLADFVAASLTGVAATEQTHAASWGLLNLEENEWDAETLDRLDLPVDLLPPVRASGAPLAPLKREIADSLGLSREVMVCSPVGDNQASVIGAAGLGGTTAVLNLGTGGQISLPTPKCRIAEGLETRPMPFGGFIQVGASLCGGWSYAYLREFLQDVAREIAGREMSDDEVYERMNDLANGAPMGADGLCVDTRFAGVRGAPDVCGSVSGIDSANLTPGNLTRAFAEGMVRELADMARGADLDGIERVVASGNGVRKNPLVARIIEEQFGAPCVIGEAPEEAALGAGVAAAIGLGLIDLEAGP